MLLKIEKMVYGGDGLARLPPDENGPGKALFVPFVLEGEQVNVEVVEQKRGFAKGRAEQVVEASHQRVAAMCRYFERCGGCHYQHTNYAHQLEIKSAILKENLRRLAGIELETELKVHPSPPWNYRNRTRLKVQNKPSFALGFYKLNSHELLPVEECPISSATINRAIRTVWELGRAGTFDGLEEVEFFASSDDSQLLAEFYLRSVEAKDAAMQAARRLKNALPELAGVVLFLQPSRGTEETKEIGRVGDGVLTWKNLRDSYRVSAGSFFQVNRHMTDELIRVVTDGREGKIALDLYAGVGLFSTVLAHQFTQVIAVEASPISHADLRYNCPPNVRTVRATSGQFLKESKVRADLVVADPSRNGLGDEVVRELARLSPGRITYVSCDPATLSRDLRGLLQNGYRVEQAHLMDLFPQTFHLESIFILAR